MSMADFDQLVRHNPMMTWLLRVDVMAVHATTEPSFSGNGNTSAEISARAGRLCGCEAGWLPGVVPARIAISNALQNVVISTGHPDAQSRRRVLASIGRPLVPTRRPDSRGTLAHPGKR